MTLSRWTRNGNLLRLHGEVHCRFHATLASGEIRPLLPVGWLPGVTLHEIPTDYTVEMDLPGVNPNDMARVKASYKDGVLRVQAPKAAESLKRGIAIDIG